MLTPRIDKLDNFDFLSSGTDIVLTDSNQNHIMITPTANINLNLPAITRPFKVVNLSATFTIQVKSSDNSNIELLRPGVNQTFLPKTSTPTVASDWALSTPSEFMSAEGDISASFNNTVPSGTVTQKYEWYKLGKQVTLTFRYEASIAGTNNTIFTFILPSDCPLPRVLSNADSNEWQNGNGGAAWSTLPGGTIIPSSCLLDYDGSVFRVYSYLSSAINARYVSGTLIYLTDQT